MSLLNNIKPGRCFLLLAFFLAQRATAQNTRVLAGNGNYSSATAPQGALKYQRQFFLIDSAELSRTDLKAGTSINRIGFTIATPQDSAAKGLFRVYLQNTNDQVSRRDTGWITVNVTGTSLSLSGLKPGQFDWQVKTACSDYSRQSTFELTRETCQPPTRLASENVTATAATLRWTNPVSYSGPFKVEYSRTDTVNWVTATVAAGNTYTASGLKPDKTYQWKVSSTCSSKSEAPMASFATPVVSSCAAITTTAVGARTNATAQLSWAGTADATQYQVQYRRAGTELWNVAISLSPSLTLDNLAAGTAYEWRVRSLCGPESYGSYTGGPVFSTAGTATCYPPENLYVDALAATSATLAWEAAVGATTYTVRYRQRDIISWSSAIAGMTQVHNDSLQVPDTIGAYHLSFQHGNAFQYNGKGLYVAYEFIDTVGRLSTSNVSLAHYQKNTFKDVQGVDSANFVLSFGAYGNDSLETTLSAANFRPETWLGSNTVRDSAAVLAVYAMGQVPLAYGTPTPLSALIRNYTTEDKTYHVTLTIKNAANVVKHTETVSATVKADSLLRVPFTDWTPVGLDEDSIIVSLPAQPSENVLVNNKAYYLQSVNSDLMSYATAASPLAGTGIDTAAGLVLSRFRMGGCGAVNSVQVYLHTSAAGHPVSAVVLDATGSVLSQSTTFTPDSSTVNQYHTFYFETPVPVAANDTFYTGLAHTHFAAGYAPVGVQWEEGIARSGAYFRANSDGSGLREVSAPGRLMIAAGIVASSESPLITGNPVLCKDASTTLRAASITRRFANRVVEASSEGSASQFAAAQILGAPNVYPNYELGAAAWTGGGTAAREHIVLKFPSADNINYIELYEVYNTGAVDTVYVKNPSTGAFDIVYTGTAAPTSDSAARINRIGFPLTAYKVDEVRIALNAAISNGYNAIDAVSIGQTDPAPSFTSYHWSKTVSGVTTSLGTGTSITTSTPGTYTLSAVTSGGCHIATTQEVTAPFKTPPVVVHDPLLTICAGDSLLLTASKRGGNTWNTGYTGDVLVVKTSGSYSFTHNDGSGCAPLPSDVVAVAVNALPVITVSGNLGICIGTFTTLTAAAPGNFSYRWSNGTTASQVQLSSSGPVTVTASDAFGCSADATVTTTLVPKPTPKIAGIANFCPGGSTLLNVAAGYQSYQWSTGQSSNNLTVSSTGKYYVTVTDNYGCTGADTLVVGRFAAPTPRITGNLSLCGAPATLNAGSEYVAYSWSTNETSSSIRVNNPGVYTVNVVDYNGCTGTASAATIKDTLPPAPGPISGQNTGVCGISSNNFSIDAIPQATHYVWTVPDGVTIIEGQGKAAIKVSFGPAFRSGEIVVAASNACGQSGSLNPRIYPVNVRPARPLSVAGTASGVCSSTKTYTTQAVAGTTSYNWQLPVGASFVSGQGTTAVSVRFTGTFTSGDICVTANNACGASDTRCFAVKGNPNTPDAIAGPATACVGQKNVTYSVADVPGASSYLWTVPPQAIITAGQGTRTIKVTFGNTSGNVTVTARNSCGSSAVKTLAVPVVKCSVTRTTQPGRNGDVPQVEEAQEILASAGNTNKLNKMQIDWTLGEPCVETVGSQKRLYSQGFHQPLVVLRTDAPAMVTMKVTAAPNPVSHRLKVTITVEKEELYTLRLLDGLGQVLLTRKVLSSDRGIELDLSALPQAIYHLQVSNPQEQLVQTFKIVKVN